MKKLISMLSLALTLGVASQAKAHEGLITLGSYFASSTVGFLVCMQDSNHTVPECLFVATVTTAITMDAYDKEALQQASDDAAAFLAGVAQPSAILNQIFAEMRKEPTGKSAQFSDQELAYAVMETAEALLTQTTAQGPKTGSFGSCTTKTRCSDGQIISCTTYGNRATKTTCTWDMTPGFFVECTGLDAKGQWTAISQICGA
ncbi:MAG: hypothetical protein A2X94_15445 [Bdellovibrionales bacterium GWB1_55_8]|nr:MAG: hypothetical protein A2X94_15445 [Bdellovibrionales bacterium GWB1_55_8]